MRPELPHYLLKQDLNTRRRPLQWRAIAAAELADGLRKRQFVAYFQPVVAVRTGALQYIEATLRWLHPQRGVLTPCDFLCEADQYGLLEQVVWQLIDSAAQALLTCRDAARDTPAVPVALHLSGAVLRGEGYGGMAWQLADYLSVRSLASDALLFEPQLPARALDVETILDWYQLSDTECVLAQGEFIAEAQPPCALPQALQCWYDSYRALSATADLPEPCYP